MDNLRQETIKTTFTAKIKLKDGTIVEESHSDERVLLLLIEEEYPDNDYEIFQEITTIYTTRSGIPWYGKRDGEVFNNVTRLRA